MKQNIHEVNEVIAVCMYASDTNTTKWPDHSFEQGVLSALLWITGQQEDHPLDE
jgi:hypothetical protein